MKLTRSLKLTRRKLASAILVPAAAALAQNQPAPPATPEAELQAARDRLKTVADALTKQAVPMDTEPALQFRA